MKLPAFLKKTYYPLNRIEISTGALLYNYQYLSQLAPGVEVAPVLKSNAYGHGLVLVAKILDESGAPFFCVDSIYEAYELLKHKIKTPILIMGYVNPENLRVKKLPFSYAVYDRDTLAAIKKYQPHANIHIFVDTGMHREGIQLSELPEFLTYLHSLNSSIPFYKRGFTVQGLMSHLAAPDQYQNSFTQKQIANFEKAKELVQASGFRPKWFHLSASGGLLHHKEYQGKIGNLARTGIALYGFDPDGKDTHLQPALQLTSTLNQVKHIEKGEKVGYDFTYTAPKDMTIGILPLGYHDGVDRRLSNKGFVTVNRQNGNNSSRGALRSREANSSRQARTITHCPIIGRVSMNLTIIDVSNVPDAKVGDEVIVYSDSLREKNSLAYAAKLCDTIPYDLLVHLASSTKRVAR